MPVIHLLGQVLPEPVKISVGHGPTIKWESPDIALVMEFKNHIKDSKIDVECTLNRWGHDTLVPVYMRALDLCRASVDVVAFSIGYGLSVQLHTLVDPSGKTSDIVFSDPALPPLCTAYSLSAGFDEVHSMVLSEPTLFMAFNDLIAAITLPHKAPVNCARAMDRLKHLITPSNQNKDKAAWEAMRSALRIDETYLKFITDSSTAPRHGRPDHVSGAITTEVTVRAWTVMNRYLEYRKSGGVLPSALPVLTG